jgi:hypothetical protein
LAQIDSSAGNLVRRVANLLEDLKVSPLVLGMNDSAGTVTYGGFKSTIVSALYFPATWSSLATLLAAVLERNASAYAAASASAPDPFPPSLFPDLSGPEVLDGIQCADKSFRANTLAEMLPTLARFESESWIRGDGDAAVAALQCARWKFASKERYTGTFDKIQTKFPALIVGNSIDPTTPLASARNLSEGLKGSVLLQNNGYGVSAQDLINCCHLVGKTNAFGCSIPPLPPRLCVHRSTSASTLLVERYRLKVPSAILSLQRNRLLSMARTMRLSSRWGVTLNDQSLY